MGQLHDFLSHSVSDRRIAEDETARCLLIELYKSAHKWSASHEAQPGVARSELLDSELLAPKDDWLMNELGREAPLSPFAHDPTTDAPRHLCAIRDTLECLWPVHSEETPLAYAQESRENKFSPLADSRTNTTVQVLQALKEGRSRRGTRYWGWATDAQWSQYARPARGAGEIVGSHTVDCQRQVPSVRWRSPYPSGPSSTAIRKSPHFIVLGRRHLNYLVAEFLEHYHLERPHHSLGNHVVFHKGYRRKTTDSAATLSLRDVG